MRNAHKHARRAPRLAFAVVWLGCAGLAGAATEQDVRRALDRLGIPYDDARAAHSIAEAILRTADPGAEIGAASDAAAPPAPGLAVLESWSEGIVYARIRVLRDGGARTIAARLRDALKQDTRGLILDLRAADGDDLGAVAAVARLFAVRPTTLYRVRSLADRILETVTADAADRRGPWPLIVLVDERTGGAAEILAGVLRGWPGVLLVGTRTRGDPGLREDVPLNESEVARIVTRTVTFGDESQGVGKGLAPDVFVSPGAEQRHPELPALGKERIGKPVSDKARADRQLMERVQDDLALRRATDILLALPALEVGRIAPPETER